MRGGLATEGGMAGMDRRYGFYGPGRQFAVETPGFPVYAISSDHSVGCDQPPVRTLAELEVRVSDPPGDSFGVRAVITTAPNRHRPRGHEPGRGARPAQHRIVADRAD